MEGGEEDSSWLLSLIGCIAMSAQSHPLASDYCAQVAKFLHSLCGRSTSMIRPIKSRVDNLCPRDSPLELALVVLLLTSCAANNKARVNTTKREIGCISVGNNERGVHWCISDLNIFVLCSHPVSLGQWQRQQHPEMRGALLLL